MKTFYDMLNDFTEERTDAVSPIAYVTLNCAR